MTAPHNGPNRAELFRRLVALRAAAAACETVLKAGVTRTFEAEGCADTSRIPGVGQLIPSLSQDGAAVVDQDAFMAWLTAAYPTEVVEVTRLEVRNPQWSKRLLAGLTPMDPDELHPGESTACIDGEGSIIPGVVWRKGGVLLSVAIRPDPHLTREMAERAEAYVHDGAPIPGLEG